MYKAYSTLDDRSAKVVRSFVLDAIDRTFATFLDFLEAREIKLMMKSKNGKSVDLLELSDGLAGEPFSDEGWIARYSSFKKGRNLQPREASEKRPAAPAKKRLQTVNLQHR